MPNIPMRAKEAINQNTLLSINTIKVQEPFTSNNIQTLNKNSMPNPQNGQIYQSGRTASRTGTVPGTGSYPGQTTVSGPVVSGGTAAASGPPAFSGTGLSRQVIPPLTHPVQKGQKFPIGAIDTLQQIRVCLGWNANDPRCDVDVSAFLLGDNGKVLGDSWFVFYGQTESPDASTTFSIDGTKDREIIRINFTRLNSSVRKIVFVLTINEAFEKRLNFGMMQDAYLRILNERTQSELVSFRLTDYYPNVISMMIGEVYQHNGSWKFNAVGNGLAKDLAGLCEWYGVQVV